MSRQFTDSPSLNRRALLACGLSAGLALATGSARCAQPDRRLTLYGVHTGEFIDVTYFKDGEYNHRALAQINHALRDHRQNESIQMDIELIELLHYLHTSLAVSQPIQFISGYRTPKTNAALRAAGRGVAKRSYHLLGRAIDILPAGVPFDDLVFAAKQREIGGVGRYNKNRFVHLDTGPVRYWER